MTGVMSFFVIDLVAFVHLHVLRVYLFSIVSAKIAGNSITPMLPRKRIMVAEVCEETYSKKMIYRSCGRKFSQT